MPHVSHGQYACDTSGGIWSCDASMFDGFIDLFSFFHDAKGKLFRLLTISTTISAPHESTGPHGVARQKKRTTDKEIPVPS